MVFRRPALLRGQSGRAAHKTGIRRRRGVAWTSGPWVSKDLRSVESTRALPLRRGRSGPHRRAKHRAPFAQILRMNGHGGGGALSLEGCPARQRGASTVLLREARRVRVLLASRRSSAMRNWRPLGQASPASPSEGGELSAHPVRRRGRACARSRAPKHAMRPDDAAESYDILS